MLGRIVATVVCVRLSDNVASEAGTLQYIAKVDRRLHQVSLSPRQRNNSNQINQPRGRGLRLDQHQQPAVQPSFLEIINIAN